MASDPADEGVPTVVMPPEVPKPSPLAFAAAGLPPPTPTLSITSAADALRDEEIARTRKLIAFGWPLCTFGILTVFFVRAPTAISAVFVTGLVIGMLAGVVMWRAFADPAKFTEGRLVVLAVIVVINGHLAVLFYGAFSGIVLLVVVGIHFIARTELDRVARWIFWVAVTSYAVISSLIVTGIIRDPGVFASDRPLDQATLATGAVFVLGTYLLAYHSARVFRATSLTSLEELQRATRLASQREALMDELRADLERALRVGGPGRYTGEQLGRYKLGIVLGRGAMGEVYDAADADTGAPAAVKLLRRELLSDPTQLARFLRELRASSALASPHVVRVLEASQDGDPVPYFAMERLSGRTLAELLREQPRLAEAPLLELVRHAAAGIDAAAAAGIVHRDLKPQNLFRCDDGTWKILDFGVATLAAENTGTLTQGDVVGTPHYMAPEQARGQRVDTRADLYALGAIAYRCATGRHPFNAPDTPSLLYQVVHKMPVRPSALAELPADVDRWCALALAKAPDDRFASGRALADAAAAAFAGALDAQLRRRADALVRKQPWEAA
ncbi:MAG: serine/threonine-protein kinase [Acidobacteriota bacterium]